jgi:hypothetical protein
MGGEVKSACGDKKFLTKQQKQLSDIEMQYLSGNWSQDEPKVPKKAKLICPKAVSICLTNIRKQL